MKFGRQLRTSLIKDYYYHYIAYDELKDALKTPLVESSSTTTAPPGPSSSARGSNTQQRQRTWTEANEREFVTRLEAELDKVYTFQRVKSGEIVRRIQGSEREVEQVIARLEQRQKQQEQAQAPHPPQSPASSQRAHGASQDQQRRRTSVISGLVGNIVAKADSDEEDENLEQDFLLLEEDLSDIIADVHDLAKFTQLNYTGFQKILKKHDKQTSWHLKPVFGARLKAKPFFKDNYDAFVVKLSRLYDVVRTRGNPVIGDSAAGGGQQNFVRQTTKYWVHADNVTEVKLIILKHLPVLVFNKNKEFEAKDSAISSIYYDNSETWELYEGRLKKTEGAEAIRLRWYGGMETDQIFVERKTHREDWTGEKSVKARFPIKEKNVNAYLAGRLPVESLFEKMRKDGKKSEEEINKLEQLAREVQYRVLTREYVPVTRSFYNRTAFQLPGDARVRVSLDTELTMVREDNLDGRERAGSNWRRTDIGIDYPFNQLPTSDVERFPHSVLEIKLQLQGGQSPPEWVRDLVSSHLVEAVPKFSKFIHGSAILQPKRIHLWPFWMPQMGIDIRKPIMQRFGIERPGQTASYTTSDDPLDDDDSDEDPVEDEVESVGHDLAREEDVISQIDSKDPPREYGTMQDPTGQAREFADAQMPNELDIEERLAALPAADIDDYPLYDSESDDEADALEAARQVGGARYIWLAGRRYVKQIASSAVQILQYAVPKPRASSIPPSSRPLAALPAKTDLVRFKAPPGKRIHVPVRVEPKVAFAAERTFLAWLEFAVVLAAAAGLLINFGSGPALNAAIAFVICACAVLLYSLVIYLWRVRMIQRRRAVRFHEGFGPTVLCLMLITSIALDFGLTWSTT